MKSLNEIVNEKMSSNNSWELSNRGKIELAESAAGSFIAKSQLDKADDSEQRLILKSAFEFICEHSGHNKKLIATYIKDCADYIYGKYVK